MTTTLTVTQRTKDAGALRAEGMIPAVVYGPKQEPVSIELEKFTFDKLFAEAGESTIITLQGLDEEIEVLVQDVSFNAERGGVAHVDFYAIERGKELTTNVALEFVGEAPVEKTGAMVIKAITEVVVTCRPSVLPSEIIVDVTKLDTEDATITVADLAVAEGVTIDTDPTTAVATVQAERAEEPETVEGEAVDMEAVEVEQKGKDETAEETATE